MSSANASYCYNQQKPCIKWVKSIFEDCLCDISDQVSFAFGLISLVCWGVAEIPQIITNFSNKSGHGVSLAFLLTWVAGSARSLAWSDTPPYGSYLRQAKSGPSALGDMNSSSEDESDSPTSKKSSTKPITIPRSVGYGTFLATSATLPFGSKALVEGYTRLSGRRLLTANHTEVHSVYGIWLGWMMAAIYMGGRIPQIFLNIKRGSVEGLNPLIILVRSTEWAKIKPNMPWLLDAVVCVALDLFIILQYIYYRFMHKEPSNDQNYGDYIEAEKPV
ncbi:PQ-loop repeat family protein / transmembrane family protein [Thalictrum thalictroides]|uniref:PQ-loop repeat family protein / transmembrane family protein n=1 Tax=Thalictrum thalictroides TaxID=46969 RepID=A0A7J6VSV1_THATH|nr:PQ-loop repeat family protein / transmembrane family protein [Thalictrum thalictroides]